MYVCSSILDSDQKERFGFEEEIGGRCEYEHLFTFLEIFQSNMF